MPATTSSSPDSTASFSVRRLFVIFFFIGATSFGMTMLESLRQAAIRRHLVSDEEMREGLALVQFYPGPIMFDLVAFIGYRRAATAGAFAAAAGFILPATLVMLIMTWAYTEFGALPSIRRLSLGLSAMVVGVMAHITFDFARRNLAGPVKIVLAASAFLAVMVGIDPVIVIVFALIVGSAALRCGSRPSNSSSGPSTRHLAAPLAVGIAVLLGALAAKLSQGTLADLTAAFMKIGAMAFGNAATILPVMQEVVVSQHRWLAQADFNLAIALGNLTPGPVLNSATFVGYRVGGLLGGLLATIAVFAPSFAMTLLAAEFYVRLRAWTAVKAAIQGVIAAFVGLLAATTIGMARPLLGDALALAAALITAIALVAGVPIARVFLVGVPLWWLSHT